MVSQVKKTVENEGYSRAALFLTRLRDEKGVRSVLMSSALLGEGSTTTAYHVAEALKSRYHVNVVVVELNVRNASLLKRLSLDKDRNLQAVANGTMSLDQAVQTGRNDVAVLGASPLAKGQDGAPESAKISEIIEQLQDRYDFVIADGPPILDTAEGLSIASVLPRVVLVVESGRNRQEILARLQQELELQRVDVLGTILNKQKRVIPSWLYRLLAR